MKFPVIIVIALFVTAHVPAAAQDQVPSSTGFGGLALGAFSYMSIATNILVTAPPVVLGDVSDANISSIFESPSANGSPGFLGGGEINYTYAETRTQLFLGNRLEDILRLDVVFGLGLRQEIENAGIVAVSYLFTPIDLRMWTDPYIERDTRIESEVDVPGFRIRWGQIFGTGLELTLTDRFYEFASETSGDWLVSEGRLDPSEQHLLDRDGDILRLQALYRIDYKTQRFEPAVRYVRDHHKGQAIANNGFEAQLTYLYRTPKLILDVNALIGWRKTKEANPIYDKVVDSRQLGLATTAFLPVKRYPSSVLNLFASIELFDEDSNADFYDTQVSAITAGVLWRFIRK